jgi:hypothetical protein
MSRYSVCRMKRQHTGSWLTIKVSEPMNEDEWDQFASIKFPTWEIISFAKPKKTQKRNK